MAPNPAMPAAHSKLPPIRRCRGRLCPRRGAKTLRHRLHNVLDLREQR